MELTRRDAVAALAAGGVAIGAGRRIARTSRERRGEESSDGSGDDAVDALSDDDLETLVAVAEAVYPSAVTGIADFVETYSRGRIERVQDDAYREGLREALAVLDDRSTTWYDGPYADLASDERASMLREIGAASADPDPDGTDAERVRHFVVNEVLFALYASPTGGELVGIENPQGHPGGLESYQRGPNG